jgi:hypothetical protein
MSELVLEKAIDLSGLLNKPAQDKAKPVSYTHLTLPTSP